MQRWNDLDRPRRIAVVACGLAVPGALGFWSSGIETTQFIGVTSTQSTTYGYDAIGWWLVASLVIAVAFIVFARAPPIRAIGAGLPIALLFVIAIALVPSGGSMTWAHYRITSFGWGLPLVIASTGVALGGILVGWRRDSTR
jgi:hypothetical protein